MIELEKMGKFTLADSRMKAYRDTGERHNRHSLGLSIIKIRGFWVVTLLNLSDAGLPGLRTLVIASIISISFSDCLKSSGYKSSASLRLPKWIRINYAKNNYQHLPFLSNPVKVLLRDSVAPSLMHKSQICLIFWPWEMAVHTKARSSFHCTFHP